MSKLHSVPSGHRVFYELPQMPTKDGVEPLSQTQTHSPAVKTQTRAPSSSHVMKYETHPDMVKLRVSLTTSKSDVLENGDSAVTNESEDDLFDGVTKETNEFFNYIYDNVIGHDRIFRGPFGDRRVVYCDYTASGRALSFLEEYIQSEVLPDYGNTHTTTSMTSLQSTHFRHEAKEIIRNAVRAGDHDAVLFVGNGCTGAVHKLVHSLSLLKPPVVLVGPFEHHSNLLPWRHLAHKVIRIGTDDNGNVCLQQMEDILKRESPTCEKEQRPLLCCMAAASNITGVLCDTDAVSILAHRYHASVFWDYASAAPYVPIDMNPVLSGEEHSLAYKDAVYFSSHKFVGGVQTPGVLVVKKRLLKASETEPEQPGGGTVFFVTRNEQLYLRDVEEREQGGTPPIVETIRAGLAMQLKLAAGPNNILSREEAYVQLAWSKFSECPNLYILGGSKAPRLPIFSFLIAMPYETTAQENATEPRRLFLHHNFVACLLNDIFGIQSRGGCSCAGPYALDLLGISPENANKMENFLVGKGLEQFVLSKYFQYPHREVVRPGFTRLNLPYFSPRAEVEFVLDAVCFLSEHAWKLLPLYKYEPVTGEWSLLEHDRFAHRKWLGHISYQSGCMSWKRAQHKPSEWSEGRKIHTPLPDSYQQSLQFAQKIVQLTVQRSLQKASMESQASGAETTTLFDIDGYPLRWFALPVEGVKQLWQTQPHGNKVMDNVLLATPSPIQPGTMALCFVGGDNVGGGIEAGDEIRNDEEDNNQLTASLNDSELPPVAPTQLKVPPLNGNRSRSNTPVSPAPSRSSDSPHTVKKSTVPSAGQIDLHNAHVTSKKLEKQRKALWKVPPKEIFKPFLTALEEYSMIQPGDRVMVCLSGGKDSLSLLHCLRQYQFYRRGLSNSSEADFQLAACTVDPGNASYDPRPLIPYLQQLGVPYYYESQAIMDTAKNLPEPCTSICAFCSRMKRGRLYAAARREGCNVLALGQHLDDLSESFIMSVFHNGQLNTMKANYTVEGGDLRVIRPLVYVREKYTRAFADTCALPVIPENCPACFEQPKERFRVKMLLAEQEAKFPQLYHNLLASMKPLIRRQRGEAVVFQTCEDGDDFLDDEEKQQLQGQCRQDLGSAVNF